jgi:hypothetical protein
VCIEVDSCASSPCMNGATCANINPLSFMCTCPLGYLGTLCETGKYNMSAMFCCDLKFID